MTQVERREETKPKYLKALIGSALRNTPYNEFATENIYTRFYHMFPETACPMRPMELKELPLDDLPESQQDYCCYPLDFLPISRSWELKLTKLAVLLNALAQRCTSWCHQLRSCVRIQAIN